VGQAFLPAVRLWDAPALLECGFAAYAIFGPKKDPLQAYGLDAILTLV
jgi:hypothetical protein